MKEHHAPRELPLAAGIGLRAPHHRQILESLPPIPWLEVHSENFFGPGGEPIRLLEAFRQHYPISLHGVGLSLGSGDRLSRDACHRHLDKLKALVDRIEPAAVSEHLCWSAIDGRFVNDLLPLPYTLEALAVVCERIDEVQAVLGRSILLENISSYLGFTGADMPESAFIAEVAKRTGCGILLDVNNIYVSARNLRFDPLEYLAAMPPGCVKEIHLAGYEEEDGLLIDSHSRPVQPAVWRLYAEAISLFGPRPTLIEWDSDIPMLETLLAEAEKAGQFIAESGKVPSHALAA